MHNIFKTGLQHPGSKISIWDHNLYDSFYNAKATTSIRSAYLWIVSVMYQIVLLWIFSKWKNKTNNASLNLVELFIFTDVKALLNIWTVYFLMASTTLNIFYDKKCMTKNMYVCMFFVMHFWKTTVLFQKLWISSNLWNTRSTIVLPPWSLNISREALFFSSSSITLYYSWFEQNFYPSFYMNNSHLHGFWLTK